MNNTPTPETSEAWDAVSRTPDGKYDSSVPMREFAYAMADHSRKLERERDEALKSLSEALTTRIQITEAAKLLSTAIDERDEAREQRDRLAKALRNLCDRFLGNKSSRDITDQLVAAGKALAALNQPEP